MRAKQARKGEKFEKKTAEDKQMQEQIARCVCGPMCVFVRMYLYLYEYFTPHRAAHFESIVCTSDPRLPPTYEVRVSATPVKNHCYQRWARSDWSERSIIATTCRPTYR